MTDQSGHCSSEQIHRLVDGRLADGEASVVREHLRTCPRCSRAYDDAAAIDHGIRSLPLQRVSPDFTEVLMKKIHKPRPSLIFLMLENAASMIGLFVVLGTMFAVFLWTGVIDAKQFSQHQGATEDFVDGAWHIFSIDLHSASSWLVAYLSLGQARGTLGILVLILVVVGALAGVDRLVGRRFVHKA